MGQKDGVHRSTLTSGRGQSRGPLGKTDGAISTLRMSPVLTSLKSRVVSREGWVGVSVTQKRSASNVVYLRVLHQTPVWEKASDVGMPFAGTREE